MNNEPITVAALGRLLAAIGGDNADLEELMQDYIGGATDLVEKIKSAGSQQDWSATRIAAHTLKSDSKNFGADRVAELCQQLETQSKNEAVENFAEIAAEIEGATEAAIARLKEIDPAQIQTS